MPPVDLVHQRHVLMTLLVGDFVDPDRLDPLQIAMPKAPAYGHFHRSKHCVPARSEAPCRLAPTELLGPTSQKPLEAQRNPLFAIDPWHPFHPHTTGRAVDATRTVHQIHHDRPNRNEQVAACRQMVIRRTSLATTRANATASTAWPYADIQCPLARICPSDQIVDKSMVTFDVIEATLALHPFSNLAVQTVSSNFHFPQLRKGMHCFLPTLR